MLTILNVLKPLLADIFDVEEEEISPAVTFEDLQADYEDMLEISLIAEEEFDVSIEPTELKKIHSVGDLIAYIEANEQ